MKCQKINPQRIRGFIFYTSLPHFAKAKKNTIKALLREICGIPQEKSARRSNDENQLIIHCFGLRPALASFRAGCKACRAQQHCGQIKPGSKDSGTGRGPADDITKPRPEDTKEIPKS